MGALEENNRRESLFERWSVMTYKRRFLCGILVISTSFGTFVPGCMPQQSSNNSQCCTVIARALESVNRITKDTTRADVEKEFEADGGIYSRDQTVYVDRQCPLIKIRVSFVLDKAYKDFVTGSPRDLVVAVSKPYLEYPAKD
jgi:hypothetical protein